MNVEVLRPSARLARATAGALFGLAALARMAAGSAQAPPVPAQREPAPAAQNAPAPAQDSADKLCRSGGAALNAKDYASAEKAFRQCRALEPANPRGLIGLSETYMAQDMFEQAIRLLETESAADPANRDIAMALGNIYVRTGKWDPAISQYRKLLDATDKQTKAAGELYLRLGETYRRKGDTASAIAGFRSARQTLPDDIRVLSALALTLESVSSWEAQQADEDVLRVSPDNAIALNNLAFSLAQHGGDLDRALSMARRARQLLPTLPEIADTLGAIYLKKGMPGDAQAVLAPLVQQQPGNAGFRAHLAEALERNGDASPAMQALAKALREEPTDANRRMVLELLKSSGLAVSP